jgi:uncharacterized protein (TIGR02996 family)
MSEREALLRAICAHPNDDTPRLVFADWLHERDEEDRAELIRAQCRMRVPGLQEDEFRTLSVRTNELLGAHGAAWKRAELPQFETFVTRYGTYVRTSPPGLRWGAFRRGFVESVIVSPDGIRQMLEHQDAICAATPLREFEARWTPQFLHFTSEFVRGFRYFDRIEVIVDHLLRSGHAQLQIEGYLNYPRPDRLKCLHLSATAHGREAAERALRPLFGDRLVLSHDPGGRAPD